MIQNPHAKWLRVVADEIAKAGHNGWGNTCLQAADEIDRLYVQTAEYAHRVLGDQSLAVNGTGE